ncbi:MAG: acyl-CoA dehydrogenase [Chitinophagaceae bacterium]
MNISIDTSFSMKTTSHPSQHITPEHVQLVQGHAWEAEQLKQLHSTQLALIQEQKWFQLFVPRLYNGLELALPEALQLEEALAWTDGSVGWTVTLCSGAGWFIGFLEPELISAVFNNEKVCLAGSGKSSGIAKIIDEGYEVTGSWDYATGSHHATAFTANCMIEEKGVFLLNDDGTELVQPFLFFREEVTLHENWNSMGMIATGSHSFEVKKTVVNKNRSFRIDPRYASLPFPIYQYPFLQFAETTLAVNSSGMAVRFLDLCEIWFKQGVSNTKQLKLENARKQIDEARLLFYNVVKNSWEECLNSKFIQPALLDNITIVSRKLALTARQMLNELYPCCGLKATNLDTEINRIWRNLQTAGQHSLLNGCNNA